MTARLTQPLDPVAIGAGWEFDFVVYGATTDDPVTLEDVYSGATLTLTRDLPQGGVLAAADVIALSLAGGTLAFAANRVTVRRPGSATADYVAGTYEFELRLIRLSDGGIESWASGSWPIARGAGALAAGATPTGSRLTGAGGVGINVFTGTGQLTLIQGAGGPIGPAGTSGPTFTHTQSSASADWTVNHNLGFRPTVAVLTAGGVEVEADVVHTSVNQLHIYLASPAPGSVRCN